MSNKIDLQGSMIGIHGPPGIGKTQLASRFPGPVKFFATEVGYTYLADSIVKRVCKLPNLHSSWLRYLEGVAKLSSSYKTVVLDTAGGLFDICQQFVCNKMGVEHPSDAGHGKGWSALKTEFFRGMSKMADKCENIGATFIFITHSKSITIETKTSNFEKIQMNLTGTARDVLMPTPDHIWFMGYAEKHAALQGETAKRALFLDGSAGVEAKCRDPRVSVTYIAPLKKLKPYEQIISALNQPKKKRS